MTTLSRIEITFPTGIVFTAEDEKAMLAVVNGICKRYEDAHPERVMWPFEFGLKMLSNPYMIADDEPLEFDENTYHIGVNERANYDWPCAACGHTQGDHKGMIADPPAGDCEFSPKKTTEEEGM